MTTKIVTSSTSKRTGLPAILIKDFGFEEDQQVEVKKWGTGVIIKPIEFKFDEERAKRATAKVRENIRKGNILEFESTKEAIEYLES